MAKIQAQDLFANSPTFTAKIIKGKPDASATSSAVTYEITCNVCKGEPFKRQGNSVALRKCAHCKTVWDPEVPAIAGAPVAAPIVEAVAPVVAAEVKIPIVETSARVTRSKKNADTTPAQMVEAKVPAKELPGIDHYVNLITKVSEKAGTKKSAKKAKPIVQHYVTEILDHYDERVSGYWYRFYYCAWYGSNELTFVREGDFSDTAMVADYEEELPSTEQYKNKFKIPTSAYKGKKVRTKEQVLEDAEPTVEAEVIAVEPQEEMVTIRISKVITIKKGEPYVAPDGYTWEYA